MQITRNSLETLRGPAAHSTGDVYVDTIASPSDASRLGAVVVRFTPGARTAWHTHPHGQTIWVTEGVGLCQREGGPVEVIRPVPGLPRARREPLARSRADPLHGARRHPAGRRRGELRRVWRARR
jgi:hypothetical protein